MNKLLKGLLVGTLVFSLTGCFGEEDTDTTEKTEEATKIGMVTDSGTIDDKSFNQGTWEGIERYAEDSGSDIKYLKPDGESATDYLASIQNLVDGGYELIVTPGYKFETAIYEAQDLYPEVNFVLIDGAPNDGDWSTGMPNYQTNENVISIFFAEQQAGFLAGVAAALETETGKVGFIGGMEIPAVQRFGWGYVAGVAYANDMYGTDVMVSEYVYQGSFDEVEAGQALAAGMYDSGIDIIFHAAGGVGVGVFNEAKTRGDVYVIGVDSDQYELGEMDNGESVTLTSALKRVDNAAYDYSKAHADGTFEGGMSVTMDVTNNGVGLPTENPNLAEDTEVKTDEVFDALVDSSVVAPATLEDLETFLTDYNYSSTMTY